MIFAIGIDIIDIKRVKNDLARWGDNFADKILGADEMKIFETKFNKPQYLGARFAAKEAIIKALGEFLQERVSYRHIQILNDPTGKPYVHLKDEVKVLLPGKKIMISLTHEKETAAAVAVIVEV
jgi:holo-[acyl-carrier protein] synthase